MRKQFCESAFVEQHWCVEYWSYVYMCVPGWMLCVTDSVHCHYFVLWNCETVWWWP